MSEDPVMPDETEPSFPTHRLTAVLAIVFAFLFSAIAVMIAENTNPVVTDVNRIRTLVRGPVVGALPHLNKKQLLEMRGDVRPQVLSEMYNLAFANLFLAMRQPLINDSEKRPIILVTSALSGEGKSTTAAQLARSMAASGKKVILVNADMRKKATDEIYDLPFETGLADVLEQKVKPEEAVRPTDTPNLYVVLSGRTVSNPLELIARPSMIDALTTYKDMADVVVVNTPASSLVADSLFLAPLSDCILNVVGAGKVSEPIVRDSIAALEAAAPNRMMFFINNAPKEQVTRYDNYYTSGYATQNGNGKGRKPKLALPVRAGKAKINNN